MDGLLRRDGLTLEVDPGTGLLLLLRELGGEGSVFMQNLNVGVRRSSACYSGLQRIGKTINEHPRCPNTAKRAIPIGGDIRNKFLGIGEGD
jgi:hypothetical protein